MLSVPGTDEQKRALTGCTNCHSVERILNSSYNAEEFLRRHQADGALFQQQLLQEAADPRRGRATSTRFVPNADKVAAYFASINRSEGERTWELKTLPRVSGDGTKVIITEYDLPDQTIQPHDVMVDADGIVWHSDFSGQILGRFDTKTLQHKSFAVPLQREGWPTGALDLEADPQGNLWLGLMFQHGAAKFDRKTEKFQMIRLPDDMLKPDSQQAMVGPQNWTVDNKLWMQDPARRGIYRVDMTTGKTELFEPFKNTRRLALQHLLRQGEQHLVPRLRRREHRQDRRQERPAHALSDADQALAPAPRPHRRRRPHLVRRIRRRAHRHVRHQDRDASRNGKCRASSSRPMTPRSTRTAICGPAA